MTRPSIREMVVIVSATHLKPYKDLLGPSRRAELCRLREQIYYEAARHGFSLPQIGRVFNRHHTSILSGLRNEQRRRGEA